MAENNAECTEQLVTETKVKSPAPTINNEPENNVEESNESINKKDLISSENCKDKLDENNVSHSADNIKSNPNAENISDNVKPKTEENEVSSPPPKTQTTTTESSIESKEVSCKENNENVVITEADQHISSVSADVGMSEEEKLKEILKVVHQDLDVKSFQKSIKSTVSKDCAKDDEEKKVESPVTANEPRKEESGEVDDSESKTSETPAVQDDSGVQDICEKMEEEKSEVGIVGPPTAISDLVNEEELRVESALSVEDKVQDHVAEWVENSANAEVLITADIEEEDNENRNEIRERRKNLRERRSKKKKRLDVHQSSARKSQKVISSIIKKSIKCLNKMHAMEGAAGNGKKVDAADKSREEDISRASPKVPQNQQNGAALPEETAAATATAEHLRTSSIKKEPPSDPEPEISVKTVNTAQSTPQKSTSSPRGLKSDGESGRKRKSTDGSLSTNGNSAPKKICLEQREQFISSLVGCDKVSADELAARADQLRAEVQALDELARAKEMEWNEILSMRKLKEEAYLRVERRRQVMGFMEGNGQLVDTLPPATLALATEWDNSSGASNIISVSKEKCVYVTKDELPEENYQETQTFKKEKHGKLSQRQTSSPKQSGENGRKQSDAQSPENRQIGEGRQGAIVDVRSIIADYRLRHPETVPRRGRRMRNSVNVGLGAGGAMVETHNVDSRPSSTDSCKSNPNADANNSMSFKDVLVQFAKLSQQQGEPVKTPQNYPDVTLHPVAPSPAPQNTTGHQTGSLLHGILTKSQSPRPTTFSPTLARLLTAPERERSAPTVMPQQNAATHLLQAYQGSNAVSISDLLSSSKARTEITITPVVNTSVQSHSNNLIHVEDVEEDSSIIEERETRISSGGRESREDRDSPPRCQGCHERAAQFVCAGCGNQWYCSRECQVAAWDEHSEVCSG